MTILGRQPAFWIGLLVTIVLGIIQTLTGEGLISDAASGQLTDGVNALAQLATLFAPLIAGLLIKPAVTPTAEPKLQEGTPVLNPAAPGGDTPPPDLVVARVENVVTATPTR